MGQINWKKTNPYKHEILKTGKIRYLSHLELRGRAWGLRTSKRRKTIHRMMKKSKYLVNACLLGRTEAVEHREEF